MFHSEAYSTTDDLTKEMAWIFVVESILGMDIAPAGFGEVRNQSFMGKISRAFDAQVLFPSCVSDQRGIDQRSSLAISQHS
jgi:hypothetical protein